MSNFSAERFIIPYMYDGPEGSQFSCDFIQFSCEFSQFSCEFSQFSCEFFTV